MSDPAGDHPVIVSLDNGCFRVESGARSRMAWAVVSGADTWVFLDGRVHLVPHGGASRLARGEDAGALVSPMPATVLAVHVTAGQPVSRGDLLLVLEAMKMELPIRSARDGIVKAVCCQVGEIVQPDVTLIEME